VSQNTPEPGVQRIRSVSVKECALDNECLIMNQNLSQVLSEKLSCVWCPENKGYTRLSITRDRNKASKARYNYYNYDRISYELALVMNSAIDFVVTTL